MYGYQYYSLIAILSSLLFLVSNEVSVYSARLQASCTQTN